MSFSQLSWQHSLTTTLTESLNWAMLYLPKDILPLQVQPICQLCLCTYTQYIAGIMNSDPRPKAIPTKLPALKHAEVYK